MITYRWKGHGAEEIHAENKFSGQKEEMQKEKKKKQK